MSDLKYQTLAELKKSRRDCATYMEQLSQKLNGQKERLKWIDKYIQDKTAQEMTLDEIERRLGHKVILR